MDNLKSNKNLVKNFEIVPLAPIYNPIVFISKVKFAFKVGYAGVINIFLLLATYETEFIKLNNYGTMNFSHRNRGRKEVRDIWVRAFPLQSLNQMILSSLSKSEAGSKLQSITVAKFILTEIMELQKFNQECIQQGVPEFVDTEEVNGYLVMFDELFRRIICETEWNCESKTELTELVSRHREEGSINFDGTSIPEMLVKAISPERIQDTLLEALLLPTNESHINSLIQICSPGSPDNFHKIMDILLAIFLESCCHSKVMNFTRELLHRLEDQYKKKFLLLIPTYFQPLVFMYQKCQPFLGDVRQSAKNALKAVVLYSLESVYNSASMKLCDLNEKSVSFYVAATCPKFLPVLEETVKLGEVTFKDYPYLWMYLHSVKSVTKGKGHS